MVVTVSIYPRRIDENRYTTYSVWYPVYILYVAENANKSEVLSKNLKQKENK